MPNPEKSREHGQSGDVFPTVAAVRVISAGDGNATVAASPPDWLRAVGGGLTAGALAALAEVALTTAALTTAGAREEVVAASLHLEIEGYPLEDGCTRPGRVDGPGALPAPAETPEAGQVSMTATVQEAAPAPQPSPGRGTALRRVVGAVTDTDGTVLATASALCAVVPAPALPAAVAVVTTKPTGAAGGAAGTSPTPTAGSAAPAAVPVPAAVATAAAVATEPVATAGRAESAADDHATLPVASVRPLIGSLEASIKTDGDRTWVRFSPSGWQSNRAGGVHGAAACAVADAAVDVALARVLPAGSAVQVRSLEMTFLRSIPLDADVEAVATVVHVGRRLAVVDCEIGPAGARPSALARVIAARTTHR